MLAFVNGRILPEAEAVVPISDRGLLYGDALFETMRVRRGQPVWWARHFQRLQDGAAFLRIPLAVSPAQLRDSARELIDASALADAVLRILLTRGSGQRGYSPRGAGPATLAMTLHPAPAPLEELRLITVRLRLPANDPLRSFKTANRLLSVLARAEAEEHGGNEALLLNEGGLAVEAAGGNLFWIEEEAVCTPPLAAGPLPGVMRSIILEWVREQGRPIRETAVEPAVLRRKAGLFITNSVAGIAPVVLLDKSPIAASPTVCDLRARLQERELAEGLNC